MARRSALIAGIAFLTFFSFSCQDTSILGVITIPEREDEVSSISVIRMEPVAGENTSRATVSLDNEGDRAVSISKIVHSNPEVFSIYSSHIPGEIEPGGRALIEISFHPKNLVPHESAVSIYLDGRNAPIEFIVSAEQ